MMNTLPEENFVEPEVRRGISNSTPPPIRPISASPGAPWGMPMSTVSTMPACSLPGEIQSPGLAWWKVAVASARTAAPSTSPVEALTPLGTSAAITRARAELIARMTASAGSRGLPSKPVPSTASTIACAFWRRSGWNGTGAGPGRTLTCACASSPIHSGGHTASTSTSRPAWRSRRAATSPSPPLLPLPQTIGDAPGGRVLADGAGEPLPRALHQLARGHALRLDRPLVGRPHQRRVGQRLEPARVRHAPTIATAPAMARVCVIEIATEAPSSDGARGRVPGEPHRGRACLRRGPLRRRAGSRPRARAP